LLYILWGQDDFSINQALEEIKTGLGDPASLLTNTTIFEGQQLTMGQLQEVCGALPFLAEKRLVIVKGLLERFEAKSKSNRQKKNARSADWQNEFKLLGDYTGQMPDSTILVIIGYDIKSGNPLLRELADKAKVRSFPFLKGEGLNQWVRQRVTQEGGIISPGAVDLLVRLVGGNLWVMTGEINKLVMYASGRRIEEGDVKTVVGYVQQTNVFALVDAIVESKAGVAEKLLQQLLQIGVSPAFLLTMLSRQLRLIVLAKTVKGRVKSRTEIQHRLGLAEFALRKTLEQADRYPWERIKEVYRRVLETDLSIKTGKYDGELALDILVAELCQ